MALGRPQSANLDTRIVRPYDDGERASLLEQLELGEKLYSDRRLMSRVTRVESIWDINVDDLIASKQTLVFDNKGTLYPEDAETMPSNAVDLLQRLAEAKVKVCILPDGEDFSPIFPQLGIKVIKHAPAKPEEEAFERAAQAMETDPKNCRVIGDKLLEDGGGLPLGMSLTLVETPRRPQGILRQDIAEIVTNWLTRREERRRRHAIKEKKHR